MDLTVVVDQQTLEYLDGGTVDFVDGPDGGSFTIENPNLVAKPQPYGEVGAAAADAAVVAAQRRMRNASCC